MYEKIILKFFISVLKKHHAYYAFLENLISGRDYRGFYDEIVDETEYIVNKIKTQPDDLLVNAFNWGDDDDVDWMSISWEWSEYVWYLEKKFNKN
jgi:hypothetical protein